MCVRNRHRWTTFLLIVAAAAALLPVRTAHGAAYTYSTRQRTINAGILLVDDAGSGMNDPLNAVGNPGASDPAPYVFYILNQRSDIKPLGWNIVNPLAPPVVTGAIQARWDARTGNTAAGQSYLTGNNGHVYALNQPITPNMAPYWEVSLSSSQIDDLFQFDVLLLNLRGHTIRLTMSETEKLRRFVDGGGQLWVDDSGGGSIVSAVPNPVPNVWGMTAAYGPLFFDVGLPNTASAGQAVLPVFDNTLLRHPIIDTPYLLSNSELNGLGLAPQFLGTITDSAGTGLPDTSFLSTVLGTGSATVPVVSAGQLGAGQVIVTTTGSSAAINNAVGGVNCGWGANSGPYTGTNFAAAPVADLKLLSNILSWDTAHPTEHKNSHQTSGSRSSLGPAVSALWSYPVSTPTGSAATPPPLLTPGAALDGNYVFVRDVAGILHAFNAQPGTDILGTGTPDAGVLDYASGFPYDEIWNSAGKGFPGKATISLTADPYASAPTVATVYTGNASSPTQSLVFIEDRTGVVHVADAITGVPYGSGTLPGSGGSSSGATYTAGPAPAPTVYDGYVFAGQPDGHLYVYSFVKSSVSGGFPYPVTGTSSNTEPVIAPPAVGVVRENAAGTAIDDIVAAVPTNAALYTVLVGSRHDPLTVAQAPATGYAPRPAGVQSGTTTFLPDYTAANRSYEDDSTGYPLVQSTYPMFPFPAPTPVNGNTSPQEYADYNVDFTNGGTSAGNNLNRAQFTANPVYTGGTSYAAQPATISAPALDPYGFLYYTVNLPTGQTNDSTLVCAHDARRSSAPQSTNRMAWRFRLPFANEADPPDADGISYQPLAGFQFAGAPVVDSLGNVFVLAFNNSNPAQPQAAILCFNGRQAVTVAAIPGGGILPNSVTVQLLLQPVPGSGLDEFGVNPQPIRPPTQFSNQPDSSGNLTLYSFGQNNINGISNSITPNLSEPQPVTVSYTTTSGAGAVSTVNPAAAMHTNLAWYALLTNVPTAPNFSLQAPVSPNAGLTLVGNYLFFGDSAGNVYRFYAYPQNAALVGLNRVVPVTTVSTTNVVSPTVDATGRPIFAHVQTSTGGVGGVLSAGNNVMIVNGTAGITALGSSYSLVADSNRVLEVDSDGLASWAVDSTSEPGANGASITHLDLNHPSSIFQYAPNDYLVADTGNNRCVRFDRSGQVTWELTRFIDTPITQPVYGTVGKANPLLTPGEPTTLSHPTSIQTSIFTPPDPGGGLDTVVQYLIADTGNYRILEVVDVYNPLGQLVTLHNLVWISHTYDRQGRRYGYTSASVFVGPPDQNNIVKHYVAALVPNVRLAAVPPITTPATGQLGPASADAPGSTLVLLDYDPVNAVGSAGFGSNGQADGFISHAISTYSIYVTNGNKFDINSAPKLRSDPNSPNPMRDPPGSGSAQPVTVYLRNPRFLQTYTQPGAPANALQNFLLADDNGVFDLFLDTGGVYGPANHFVAQWGMTQADYQTLPTPGTVNGSPGFVPAPVDATVLPGANFLYRNTLRFAPNSIQRIGTEQVPDTTSPSGSYLMGHYIVTNGYSQGTVTGITGFGGESLEVNDIGNNLSVPANSNGLVTQDYSSFSKPSNTEPLSQPAFSVREK